MRRVIAGVLLLLPIVTGCETADQIRRDFVSPRYIQQAEANVVSLPRDTEAATRAVDRALTLKPDDLDVQLRAARVYAMARAWEKAIPLFEEQAELATRDRIAYAYCLLHTEQQERGAQICLEVIARAQQLRDRGVLGSFEWALYLNDAGYILADAGVHVEEAHEAIAQAVEAFPLQAAFVDSLGWVLFQGDELKDAAFYLERARRLSDREDPEVLYHLGVVYSRLDRYAEAYEVLRRARELDPGWEPITEELRRLGRILPPPALAGMPENRSEGEV